VSQCGWSFPELSTREPKIERKKHPDSWRSGKKHADLPTTLARLCWYFSQTALFFAKPYFTRPLSGGLITVVSFAVMLALFFGKASEKLSILQEKGLP